MSNRGNSSLSNRGNSSLSNRGNSSLSNRGNSSLINRGNSSLSNRGNSPEIDYIIVGEFRIDAALIARPDFGKKGNIFGLETKKLHLLFSVLFAIYFMDGDNNRQGSNYADIASLAETF